MYWVCLGVLLLVGADASVFPQSSEQDCEMCGLLTWRLQKASSSFARFCHIASSLHPVQVRAGAESELASVKEAMDTRVKKSTKAQTKRWLRNEKENRAPSG